MNDQQELDWTRRHVHRGDPDTSRAAAKSVVSSAKAHRQQVFRVLFASNNPLAVSELEARMPLKRYQIARRLSDLRNDKEIADSGFRHMNSNGRQEVKWQVCPR